MNIKISSVILRGAMIVWVLSSIFGTSFVTYAQSTPLWSDPVNLSNSGSSLNPSMVIDANGAIHVIWVDTIDGYEYVRSEDGGVTWTTPKGVRFPFSLKNETQPLLLAGKGGEIHILWLDAGRALYYSQASALTIDTPTRWTSPQRLSDSVLSFDAIVSAANILHLGYVRSTESKNRTAGIYYHRLDGAGWSIAKSLYSSRYYRSLTSADSNISLAVSQEGDLDHVFVAWDDRTQKRIFWAKSSDTGNSWDTPIQVRGPEESSGLEFPYNVTVQAMEKNVLLIWQAGLPGNQCSVYSQWSSEDGNQLGSPIRVLDEFQPCPLNSKFIVQNKEYSLVMLSNPDDFSLVAWNGSRWSNAQISSELTTFVNPSTLDSVLLGCSMVRSFNERLFWVGCDKSRGGDIWFASSQLESITGWFPPPSAWTVPALITSDIENISQVSTVADNEDANHLFWAESKSQSSDVSTVKIQYARLRENKWSTPAQIFAGAGIRPIHLTAYADETGRLLLAWIDQTTGDMVFSWANSNRANSSKEWKAPVYIPSVSKVNGSLDMLVDTAGKIIVVYAISINEQRGLYLTTSDDAGTTWSQPIEVFDAVQAAWDVIDEPKVALTGDGRLHVLFNRFTLIGSQRRSIGLYSISMDAAGSWTAPELVSDQPILWSEILGYDRSILHRLWQEEQKQLLVSLHQVSQDGGLTWSRPATVSTVREVASPTVTLDRAGNLHFLEIYNENPPTVTEQEWNGSVWTPQEAIQFNNMDQSSWISITASLTSHGVLNASLLANFPNSAGEWKYKIMSTVRNVGLNENLPTPAPALLATMKSEPLVPVSPSEILETPTQSSTLAEIDVSQSLRTRNRNLVGLLFVGGIVIVMVVIFRPRSKQSNKIKNKPE